MEMEISKMELFHLLNDCNGDGTLTLRTGSVGIFLDDVPYNNWAKNEIIRWRNPIDPSEPFKVTEEEQVHLTNMATRERPLALSFGPSGAWITPGPDGEWARVEILKRQNARMSRVHYSSRA